MKSKKLLLSTFLLFGGIITIISLGSSSNGMPGVSSTGCGGGGCHAAGSTTVSLTGVPTTGFTAGVTYPVTITVSNSTQPEAGFDLSVSAGTLSGAPAGTAIFGTAEILHTTPGSAVSGNTSWTFNWTAPTTGALVTFNVAGNAVNNNNDESGDAYAVASFNYQLASPTSLSPTVQKERFEVYPNPANDYLTIKTNHAYHSIKISALALNGTYSYIVAEQKANQEYQLDLSALASGVYFLNIQSEGQNHMEKIIKR